MKEIDIHRLIEQQDGEKKDALYKKIQSRLDIPQPQQNLQVAQKPKKKSVGIVLGAAACLCLVCVAILLPFVLKSDKGDSVQDRYCKQADYVLVESKATIREYAQATNKNMLFVDWYAVADEVITNLFVNANDSSDMIYIKEELVNGETGDVITLYITDNHTTVDVLEWFQENCKDTCNVHDITMQWIYDPQSSEAMFTYQDFRYYLQLQEPLEENSIIEIIENMFV